MILVCKWDFVCLKYSGGLKKKCIYVNEGNGMCFWLEQDSY